jgi:hypothetical protein
VLVRDAKHVAAGNESELCERNPGLVRVHDSQDEVVHVVVNATAEDRREPELEPLRALKDGELGLLVLHADSVGKHCHGRLEVGHTQDHALEHAGVGRFLGLEEEQPRSAARGSEHGEALVAVGPPHPAVIAEKAGHLVRVAGPEGEVVDRKQRSYGVRHWLAHRLTATRDGTSQTAPGDSSEVAVGDGAARADQAGLSTADLRAPVSSAAA